MGGEPMMLGRAWSRGRQEDGMGEALASLVESAPSLSAWRPSGTREWVGGRGLGSGLSPVCFIWQVPVYQCGKAAEVRPEVTRPVPDIS